MVAKQRLRYLLFDLDNTLYPESSGVLSLLDARIELYLQQHFALPEAELRQMRTRYWKDYGTTLGGLIVEHKVDAEEYLAFIHDVPLDGRLAQDPTLDQLLTRLPLPKSIFTNSTREHAERVLEILGVRRHFEHIFDIRVGGWITKPDPRVYEHVLTALGIRAEECLFVDDSAMNLEGAQALGLHTVQVVEGGGDKSAPGADYLISDLEMLENVLDDFTLPYQEEEQ